MPMMVLDDESFANEINKFSKDKSPEPIDRKETDRKETEEIEIGPGGKVVDILRGRSVGRLEIPNSIRILVADEVLKGGSAKKASEEFGVSLSSISAYKNDATSTASYDNPNEELKEANDSVREDISAQARSKLLMALEHVTDDKLRDAKLRDVASVAASMSGIIKNMEPNGPSIQNNTQVIVYKPRMREEDEFEAITVNE